MSWHWAAMVRVVISSWRIRNIDSSSASGSRSCDVITCRSRPGSFCGDLADQAALAPGDGRGDRVGQLGRACAGRKRPRLDPGQDAVGLDLGARLLHAPG